MSRRVAVAAEVVGVEPVGVVGVEGEGGGRGLGIGRREGRRGRSR